MTSAASRREADVERVRRLVAASGGRLGIVTLPVAGRPTFVLDLAYATAGSRAYPEVRQPMSRLQIDLSPRHPFAPPRATVLTPIWHPHVFTSGVVCIGSKWVPSSAMDLFVLRMVRLLAFDPLLINPHSLANHLAWSWYANAVARWPEAFPTDPAALALVAPGEDPAAVRPDAGTGAGRVVRRCPHCEAQLRLPAGRTGAVRCPRCGGEFEAST